MCSMWGKATSAAKRPRPVTSGGLRGAEPSGRRSSCHARVRLAAARSAARMRCGVAGNSSIDTPNGESASLIALTTAAGAPIAPPSPSPLACVIEACVQVSQMMDLDRRHLVRRRRQVVGERRGEDVAGVVVDDLFEQRVADALRDAALNLAVDDHRIDQPPGILRHQEFFDPHPAGLGVDLDQRDMAGVGERARRIVGRALRRARRRCRRRAGGSGDRRRAPASRSRSRDRCRRRAPCRLRARCRRRRLRAACRRSARAWRAPCAPPSGSRRRRSPASGSRRCPSHRACGRCRRARS